MIEQEKIFFLNQLVDSMERAVNEFSLIARSPNPEKQKKARELEKFILSIHHEVKNILDDLK